MRCSSAWRPGSQSRGPTSPEFARPSVRTELELLAPAGDAEALGAALVRLAREAELRRALGARNRERVHSPLRRSANARRARRAHPRRAGAGQDRPPSRGAMKLVMTLLVRDEADIVDEQIAFHLDAGVDFVVATDNRSQDGTTEILERYASEGHLHLIREPGEDLRQSEWVTRMARLAATEFGADWVLNTDADEFWWPQGAGLADVLAVVPERYGVVRAAWRNFVPRPDDGRAFFERMTARLCTPAFHHHPLSTHSKSAHRAVPDVRIGRGNHEAFGEGLLPLRGWYPLEILHFPVRSLEHCVRKYVTQFVALERNAEKGIPNHMAEAYEAYRAGRLEEFYEPLVVDDDALERGARGRHAGGRHAATRCARRPRLRPGP